MTHLIVFLGGLACVLYYLNFFSGALIITEPAQHLTDVLGKVGLMFIFFSWMFSNKYSRTARDQDHKNKLLRKNLIALMGMVSILMAIYAFLWPLFTSTLFQYHQVFNLSGLFESLPFNDLSWIRDYSNEWITKWLRLIYLVGFTLPVLFPCLICFLRGRYVQGWYYVFAGHIIQMCFAVPFYILFSIEEIWVVKHIPDGLLRVFPDPFTAASITMNNFPSMHTSVAFASLLVAQREKDPLLRYTWTGFCICVIIATFYFPIHWTLDVIGGLLVGWISVRLSRKLLVRFIKYTRITV